MSLALPSLALPATPGLPEQLLSLRRRWRIILLCTLLVPGITGIFLAHQTVAYTATGILLYDPDSATVPGDPATPAQDAQNQDAITASQSAVIASLPAASALAQQLNLAAVPEFNPALRHRHWPLNQPRHAGRHRPPPPHRHRAAGLARAHRLLHQHQPRARRAGRQWRHAALSGP